MTTDVSWHGAKFALLYRSSRCAQHWHDYYIIVNITCQQIFWRMFKVVWTAWSCSFAIRICSSVSKECDVWTVCLFTRFLFTMEYDSSHPNLDRTKFCANLEISRFGIDTWTLVGIVIAFTVCIFVWRELMTTGGFGNNEVTVVFTTSKMVREVGIEPTLFLCVRQMPYR